VFNIGPEKLILLLVIALVVLGPKRLPDAARSVGRAVGELRRVSGHLQDEVRDVLADPKDALSAAVGDLHRELGDLGAFGLGAPAVNAPVGQPSSTAAPPSESSSMPSLPPSPDDPSLN
jgi:Tat protein translocase TatB subunit